MKKILAKENSKFIFFMLFVVMTISLSFYFDLHHRFSVDVIKSFILRMGFLGPIVYMILYTITSIIFFPAVLLSTSSGVIWGPYLGTFNTVIGASLAATAPFLISRLLGRDFAEKNIMKGKMDICDRFLSRNGFMSILVMRLIPIFPWDMINYAAGLCGIRFKDYLLATIIGIIPGSFTYNLIGSSLAEPLDKEKILLIFIIVIALSTIGLFYKWYSNQKQNQAKGKS